jgi:hypothetical protein
MSFLQKELSFIDLLVYLMPSQSDKGMFVCIITTG